MLNNISQLPRWALWVLKPGSWIRAHRKLSVAERFLNLFQHIISCCLHYAISVGACKSLAVHCDWYACCFCPNP